MRSQKARYSTPRKRRRRILGKRKRCPVQGKVRYRTKLDAVTALASASKSFAVRRPYPCPHCGDWHLSSRP